MWRWRLIRVLHGITWTSIGAVAGWWFFRDFWGGALAPFTSIAGAICGFWIWFFIEQAAEPLIFTIFKGKWPTL
jgi:uncharacterized membrane protein required for colicin V production